MMPERLVDLGRQTLLLGLGADFETERYCGRFISWLIIAGKAEPGKGKGEDL
jgi:hypothetical protein